ncbi:hypothetical protein BGX24_012812, partial [Mortierella sp. AD032]
MQQHHHKQQQQSHDLSRDSFSPPPVSDSSFSSSVVVDIDAIELDKENIQPLRQGRSAQTLARLFTTQHEDRAQQQATMHGRFQEELVHIDDLDDPIDVYSRYVKWMIENYPQSAGQGHDSQLSPVIERAIADYKDDPRYRNDPRFVKLLIIYSEQITNSIDLFNFMESNGIGSEISMYYEEFADLLESREEFDRAREVFNKGISRRARPLGRLRKQYEDFKLRARTFEDAQELESARASSAQQQQQHHTQDRSVETNTGGGNQRRVLGVKISGTQSVHSNASSQGHVPIGLERPQSSSTTSATRGTTLSGQPRTDTKLQVYSDHASQPSVPKPKAIPQNPTSQPSTQWMDFGAEKIRRKENTREVTSWKGATLSSEDTVARQVHPKLEVYRDPEVTSSPKDIEHHTTSTSDEENKTPLPVASISAKITPATRTFRDDTQSHSSHEPIMRQAQPEPTRIYGAQKFPITTNASGRPERLMIDLNEIYVDALSLSVRELLPQSPSDEERQFFGSRRRLTSSPTMNTKYASEEMNKIFSDRSRMRRSMDSQWSAEDTQDVGRNELDNFTMAYSIPNLPLSLPPFPREFLEGDVVNEFEDDDDQDGRTERFVRGLENDFSSTITQDIAALKRR